MTNKKRDFSKARSTKSMKFAGFLFLLLGTLCFLDSFGIASSLNLTLDSRNKLIGGLLVLMGILDIFIIPRILQAKKPR